MADDKTGETSADAGTTAAAEAAPAATTDTTDRNRRKIWQGYVISDKMNKTIVVREDRLEKHKTYKKYVKKHTRFYVHDEAEEAKEGDRVEIMETRPLSKRKRWRLLRVIERRER